MTAYDEINSNIGNIKVSEDVVTAIVGLTAIEIEGVAAMSGGVVGGIAEMLGRKNFSKGVKVEVEEDETTIDLFIIVDFGAQIPEVALKIQERVKEAVEKATGLTVMELNVHVQGVHFFDNKVIE